MYLASLALGLRTLVGTGSRSIAFKELHASLFFLHNSKNKNRRGKNRRGKDLAGIRPSWVSPLGLINDLINDNIFLSLINFYRSQSFVRERLFGLKKQKLFILFGPKKAKNESDVAIRRKKLRLAQRNLF